MLLLLFLLLSFMIIIIVISTSTLLYLMSGKEEKKSCGVAFDEVKGATKDSALLDGDFRCRTCREFAGHENHKIAAGNSHVCLLLFSFLLKILQVLQQKGLQPLYKNIPYEPDATNQYEIHIHNFHTH